MFMVGLAASELAKQVIIAIIGIAVPGFLGLLAFTAGCRKRLELGITYALGRKPATHALQFAHHLEHFDHLDEARHTHEGAATRLHLQQS